MKEHQDDEEKSRKDKKINGLSQNMNTTGHSPVWDDVRVIYREYNWKKRKFKEAARIASHNKKDERKTISNLWNIELFLKDKTLLNLKNDKEIVILKN